MRVHHIGYAVKKIQHSTDMFSTLGYEKLKEAVNDLERGVIIQLMKNGPFIIELVSPIDKDSPINTLLERTGSSPYHICYETDDIQESIAVLRKKKFTLIEAAKPAIIFNMRKVAFLYHQQIGLIELLEKLSSKNESS